MSTAPSYRALLTPTATHGPDGTRGPPGAGRGPLRAYPIPLGGRATVGAGDLVQELDLLGEPLPRNAADPALGGRGQCGQAVEVVERDLGEQLGRQGPAVAQGDPESDEGASIEEVADLGGATCEDAGQHRGSLRRSACSHRRTLPRHGNFRIVRNLQCPGPPTPAPPGARADGRG